VDYAYRNYLRHVVDRHEFRENWLGERHSLLHGVSEFVPHFSYFLTDFGETRYRRPLRIPFEQVPLL